MRGLHRIYERIIYAYMHGTNTVGKINFVSVIRSERKRERDGKENDM